jgi:hypothetical protein
MPLYTKYEKIRYDDPNVQAEFQRLVEEVAAAERARAPIQEQHRRAEGERDRGKISDSQYNEVDNQYISANNTIARAIKKVDEFLGRNKDYQIER